MEEVIEMLSEDPERTAGMAYGAALTTGSAYVAYRNDFGAEGRTTNELETYLEETDGINLNPVTLYKRRVYSRELEERNDI